MLCLLVPGSAVLLASRPKYVCDKAAPKKTTEMSPEDSSEPAAARRSAGDPRAAAGGIADAGGPVLSAGCPRPTTMRPR